MKNEICENLDKFSCIVVKALIRNGFIELIENLGHELT